MISIPLTLPLDKLLHLLAGVVIALALGYVAPWWIGLALATTIGAAKEMYDSLHTDRHTPDVWDFVVTAFGGIVGSLIVLLCK